MDEWISVEDRMPERGEVVLIAHYFHIDGILGRNANGNHVWFAKWDGGCWKRADHSSDDPVFHGNVKYWQPMPTAPRKAK